jgi:uncharacterized membrane protein
MTAFLLLAVVTSLLDRTDLPVLAPAREVMRVHVFSGSRSTADLLSVIATGVISVTSITFSLLLLAVQQAAGSLTFQVIDQFLRRRLNQIAFGFFVGLGLYALVILSTVNDPYNPVFGATVAYLLTVVALYLLLLLLYTTVDQMRPSEIVAAIHDHSLAARTRQLPLLKRTRRQPRFLDQPRVSVRASSHGFVVAVDVDALASAIDRFPGSIEIVLKVTLGSYVAFHDVIAEIATGEVRADGPYDLRAITEAVAPAVHLERQRDLAQDPGYGIEQLATIAWTSISTAKSNPAPGLAVIRSLRDLLARWIEEENPSYGEPIPDVEPVSIVLADPVLDELFDALESLAVVSTESMQHQVFAEVVRSFTIIFDRLPARLQTRTEDVLLRMLSGLGDHILTAELEQTLRTCIEALEHAGRHETAGRIKTATVLHEHSLGRLNSRSTRVPST